MSMANQSEWAARTAMRLRVVQATMAESDAESERGVEVWEFIAETMAELGSLTREEKKECLKALDREFPFYEDRVRLEAKPEEPGVVSTSVLLTHEEMARKLVEAVATLETGQIERLSKLLCAGGYLLSSSSVAKSGTNGGQTLLPVVIPTYQEEVARLTKIVEKIQSTIGKDFFANHEGLSLNRSMQILGLMCEQFLLLHPQIWGLWEGIVTNHQYTTSFNRPALPAAQALAQFLEGGSSTRRADVGQMVAKSFYLLNALVASVGTASQEFSSWFFEKFGPENIESVMNYETNGSKAGAAEYWKRYQQLAEQHNSEELREQFHNLLGKSMLRNIQRRGGA